MRRVHARIRPHSSRGRLHLPGGARRPRNVGSPRCGSAREHRRRGVAPAPARVADRERGRRPDRDDPRRGARLPAPRAHEGALPGRGRRRVRPLAHPAARGGRRVPDLQPGLAHGQARATELHDGSRARRRWAHPLRARDPGLMDLDVVFIGTAGSAPTARRSLPATLVRRGGDRLLFDCGEGTQRQLLRSIGLIELEDVFVTHYHADHWLGLPGMLKTFSLRGRERALTVYGPPGLRALFEAMKIVIGKSTYPLKLVELDPNEQLERDGYVIAPFAVEHRVPAYGYALVETERPGRFDEAKALELGVAPGPDFGRLQRGEPVPGAEGLVQPGQVLGEARPGRKVVLAGDTAPC